MRRAVVLGIHGLNPDFVESWIDDLPVLKKMREGGAWGRLESTLPPLGPHAWISSLSGRNSGAFGLWGDRYRSSYSYTLDEQVDSGVVEGRIRPLYKILPKLGQRVGAVNLPWTLQAPEIPGGFYVGEGALGGGAGPSTWPEELARDVKKVIGEYIRVVPLFGDRRSGLDKKSMLPKIKRMDEQRFALVKYLVQEKLCDIVMAVIDGAEAVSHLYLRDADSSHRFHDPRSKNREKLREYYRFIDERVGDVQGILDEDTVLCLFSVSAVQRLDGVFYLNEWLIEEGYLSVKNYPEKPVSIEDVDVDWSDTKAWAMGEGGQIYVNLKGREREGMVEPSEYNALLDRLAGDLKDSGAVKGKALPVDVFRKSTLYFGDFVEFGPDLLLLIDEGRWITDQRVGFGRGESTDALGVEEEIREGFGRFGYISIAGSDFPAVGEVKPVSVLDIAPTIIDIMNLRLPYDTIDYEMEGYSLIKAIRDKADLEKPGEVEKKEAEEERVRSRLEALGY